uniref:Vacuolar protein-sorting protein BRO1-like isoform X2 n=1 Tax=Crassostrea virginica TaxID=6565 RepID=A0A8B8B613_CRAVI|nr:vacuolar protein-sorting protein BRO1-like isoform X2 [Crassostrea virginica]
MCDRFAPFGTTNPMMPMLGEPPMGFTDPLRGSLLGLPPYGPPGYGLGMGPIVPVPLWRPVATHPSALLCNSIGCPCNRSPLAMSEILDMYSKSSLPSVDPWRPWYPKHTVPGESYYKSIDSRQSPSKELPTKLLKQDRIKERQELSQTLHYDREHLLKLKNRCAVAPQPGQPNVEGEVYRNGDHHISPLDPFSLRRHYTPVLPPAGSIRDPRGSPPKYSSLESHDAPLNLSLSSSSVPSSSSSSSSSSAFSTQIPRPSVITCAPTATDRNSHYTNVSPPHTPQAVASPKSRQIISGCEPDIEEHFRRSLGRDYMTSNSPKLVNPPPPPPPPKAPTPPEEVVQTARGSASPKEGDKNNPANVSITGSVDDHFAKSLGSNMWSALKAQNDPEVQTVDDHFAKALGTSTWLRIKKEKETNGSTSPPSSPQQQRPNSSLVST